MHTHLTDPTLRRGLRPSWAVALSALLATAMLASTVVPAQAASASKRTDKREIDARQAFASGKYQEALDLYAELYADKVHPTYLRNVGRCYQNLKQPDKAINAFRDYLRQAKGLSTVEKKEVEDYIAEMEQLKQQQDDAAKASAATTAPPPPPLVPIPPDPGPAGATVQLGGQVPPPPPTPTPVYKKAWFWGVVGVVVVAGVVGGLYAGGAFSKSSVPCTASGGCF